MVFDYSKLKGKIIEKYGNMYSFADAMGMSQRTLGLKMSGKIDWKSSEIMKAMKLLEVGSDEWYCYFFTLRVQNCERNRRVMA